MGASLVSGYLRMHSDKTPNWDAARKALAEMKDENVLEFLRDDMGNNGLDLEAVNEDSPDPVLLSQELAQGREYLAATIEHLRDGWGGGHMYYNKFTLEDKQLTILFTAERTWGDPCEELEYMLAFIRTGLAKAAGFDE